MAAPFGGPGMEKVILPDEGQGEGKEFGQSSIFTMLGMNIRSTSFTVSR